MGLSARDAMGVDALTVIADRGYYNSPMTKSPFPAAAVEIRRRSP
jgi:hypothetical protein